MTRHYSRYFKTSLPAPSLYDRGTVCLCCYRATRKTTCITDAKTFFTPLSHTHVCMCICIVHTRYPRGVLSIRGRRVVLLRKTINTYTMHNTTSVTAKKAPGVVTNRESKKTPPPATIENDCKCTKYDYGVCRYMYRILIIRIYVPRLFDPYFRRGVKGRTQKKTVIIVTRPLCSVHMCTAVGAMRLWPVSPSVSSPTTNS